MIIHILRSGKRVASLEGIIVPENEDTSGVYAVLVKGTKK